MRKAFVCFYEAYPPGSGAAIVTYCSAKYSSGDRLLLQVCHRDAVQRPDKGFTVKSVAANSASRVGKIMGLHARLNRVIKEVLIFAPDVIVLEGASWVMYHYLLMKRLRKALPNAKVVYHAHNVELLLRQGKHGKAVCALTRWAEGKVLRNVDRSFAVSSVDAAQFAELYGVRPDIWPNGVDTERFDLVTDEEIQAIKLKYKISEQSVLFMGLYAYKPNTEAVDFLCHDVMPKLVQHIPDVQLVITGGEVPFRASWLNNPGMIPFEDITPLVKACGVGLAPIFSGSGTRLKILEYMTAGIPVVSSRKGAEGLSSEDGMHIQYAESANEFVHAIAANLEECSAEQLTNARNLIDATYAWEIALKEFQDFCSEKRHSSQEFVAQSN